MAYTGYINPEVAKMYGIPYSQLTAEQKKILHDDSVRRSKLIAEREEAVLRNNLKAFDDEAKMERVLASIYKDCQKQILADVTETIAKVKKAGGDWSYANQSALTRSRGLFEQITAELNKLGQKEQILFTQGLSNIYTDQFLRQVYELGQSIPVKANFNRLNPALVRKTLDYPWSGAIFSDRLWNDKETLGKNLRVGLTQSMILGESIPQITDRINRNINTSRYNAERVARTETKRVTYCAHNDAYEDMGVEELEYRCANGGDYRTCDTCREDNGKHYKRGKEPTLPRHPNCRCVYIPVVSDEFGDNELNELTGSVRGAENYEKWKETYEEAINPDGSYKAGWGMDLTDGKTKYTTADGRKLTLEEYKKEKANPLTTPPKTDKVNIPEVSTTGEVFTGELGRSIRSSFDNGNNIRGYSYGWGDREEKKLQELYEQRKLLTDPAHLKQIDAIIKNHEEYKQILNTKGVLVEVEKAGTYKLKVPPKQSVDEYVRNSTYYNKYALVEFQYTKYNYDVYEERLGGKYYITMKGVSSKKEREEIYAIADKVFSQNTRAVGAKLRIDTAECNKGSTRYSTVLGFYTPSQHKLTVRNFKSYAEIYGVDLQGGKEKFAGTLAHEFAHIIHSKDIRLKDVTATADQWKKWQDLIEPYYEQYRVNKIVDVGSAWRRMSYPINAEDHYRDGRGKEHYYQEMWAECTAIIQEDVPEAKKAEELANLRKYFPKVEEFIKAFYAGGV
jgi:SPP1 gp7 family putative phage head morphogenesis protein